MMGRKMSQYDLKRIAIRDSLWPDSAGLVWNRRNESGFTTLPRTLPLIATLLRHLGDRNDPSRAYLTLWFRARDHAFFEIQDSNEIADEVGYRGNRRVRSLHEALDQLARLGFIRIQPRGTRKYAFVLLLHPHDAVQRIKYAQPKNIPDWWWSLFTLRIQEIRADLRLPDPETTGGSLETRVGHLDTSFSAGEADDLFDEEGVDDIPF